MAQSRAGGPTKTPRAATQLAPDPATNRNDCQASLYWAEETGIPNVNIRIKVELKYYVKWFDRVPLGRDTHSPHSVGPRQWGRPRPAGSVKAATTAWAGHPVPPAGGAAPKGIAVPRRRS